MSPRVRLLPVLAAVAIGVFAMRAVGLAEAAGAASANAKPEPIASAGEPTPSETTGTDPDDSTENGSDAPAACPGGFDIAEQAGLSQYEIQVLRSLGERREVLDERERLIDTREQTLAAAELRLDAQIDELKTLESNVQSLLQQLDDQSEAEILALVKIYESMNPKDAARIFDTLDDGLMVQIAQRIKPTAMAAVLADMSAERATLLTRLLAEQAALPETAEQLKNAWMPGKGSVFRSTLLGLSGLVGLGETAYARDLVLEGEARQGYGRIVASWADGTKRRRTSEPRSPAQS